MTEVAVVLVLIFFVLLLCNVPVAVAIGTASLAAVYANGGMGAPERIVADRMVSGVSSFSLLAIPFFVLSANSPYRRAAACQPSSSTNLSSHLRFVVIGAPHLGQNGTSSPGTLQSFCRLTISVTTSLLS